MIPPNIEEERLRAQEAYKTLDYLISLPQFAWYVENVLRPMVGEEAERALDVTKEREARDYAAQRHDFGQEILRAAEQKRAFWAERGEVGK